MSAAQVSTFATLPFTQLRQNRYFYLYYDGVYAAAFVAIIAACTSYGWKGLIGEGAVFGPMQLHYLLWFPVVAYLGILCNVFVHVCTHSSFPRPFNRIIGELCGMVILTRFASWEVLHQRHHRYTDDLENDPHPVVPSYWSFAWHHIVGLEKFIHQAVFDLHGDTVENRKFESLRSLLSFGTGVLLVATWVTVLGWQAFLMFFLPAIVLGFFQLVHFNWSTHNAKSPTADYRPVNLNHGLFKLGNKLFFGIYMHGNHHKFPNALNPAKVKHGLPIEPAPTKEDLEGWRRLKREVAAQAKAA